MSRSRGIYRTRVPSKFCYSEKILKNQFCKKEGGPDRKPCNAVNISKLVFYQVHFFPILLRISKLGFSSFDVNSKRNLFDFSGNQNKSDPLKPVKSKSVHKCSHCPKSFPTAYYLKFHQNSVHLKSNTFNCEFCHKSFSGHYYLRQHLKRMHSQNKPYTCEICATSFSVKYDLVVHSKTHSKTFSCEHCGKNYATKRALQEHSRTHTGERPYQCSLCKKAFALPKTLRVHFRQHSGERPYLCSHCGMTFVQNSTLRNHLKSSHKVVK